MTIRIASFPRAALAAISTSAVGTRGRTNARFPSRRTPCAARELVNLVSRRAAKERGQLTLGVRNDVHGQRLRVDGQPVGVVLDGDAREEPPRPDADLGCEADQAPRPLAAYDRYVIPVLQRVERRVAVPAGQSIFAVGRRPG